MKKVMVEKVGEEQVNRKVIGGYRQHIKATHEDGTVAWYVASYVPTTFDTGRPETLVFPSNEDGDTTDWGDVAGGGGMSIDEAVAHLKAVLEGRAEYGIFDNPGYQAAGDPLSFTLNTMRAWAERRLEDEDED